MDSEAIGPILPKIVPRVCRLHGSLHTNQILRTTDLRGVTARTVTELGAVAWLPGIAMMMCALTMRFDELREVPSQI